MSLHRNGRRKARDCGLCWRIDLCNSSLFVDSDSGLENIIQFERHIRTLLSKVKFNENNYSACIANAAFRIVPILRAARM